MIRGGKKKPAMDCIVMLLKRCLYFSHPENTVLFQQDVFPFVPTFVIFALSRHQKKKSWHDTVQLRKICDAWKMTHLSKMT